MTTKAESLSVRLPLNVREQVDKLASRTRRSRSFIIGEAVASYVQEQANYSKLLDEEESQIDARIALGEREIREGKTVIADAEFFEKIREEIRQKFSNS